MDSLRLLTRGSGFKPKERPSEAAQQIRPSASNDSLPVNQALPSRKRKRTEDGSTENGHKVSIDEVRKLHHQHKIKITDLRAFHEHDDTESRKAQKQSSRLYPQPLQHFASLKAYNVNSALLQNLTSEGYKEPTEVQMATIPLLMADTDIPDLLTIAPTGSGKTLAFMLPLINRIGHEHKSQGDDTSSRQVSAIVLAPTKELVNQIVNEGRKLAARTGVRITAFKKGMRLHETTERDENSDVDDSASDTPEQATMVKADILISTPLSLLHAISQESTNTDNDSGQSKPLPLPNITTLVLDEADILLDPLFRTQTLAIHSALTNPNLQTSLWSATIGSNIEDLALSTLNSKTTIRMTRPLLRTIVGLKDSSLPTITHKLIFTSTEPGKLTYLRNSLIRPAPGITPLLRPPFLIFTQTIPRAQALHTELRYDIPPSTDPTSPPRIAVLHSDLSTTARTKIMSDFRAGRIWILITTDLLSRGIDFRGVNGVVNYDVPTTPASYVHRAGRTGRAGREGGVCVTLYTRDDVMYLRPIANIIRKSQKTRTQSGGDAAAAAADKDDDGIPDWLLENLPTLTKNVKKELKERGVDVRRRAKESDDTDERRRKGRNTIGTRSGYDKKLENNRKGMIEASKRRKREEQGGRVGGDDNGVNGEEEFGGFD